MSSDMSIKNDSGATSKSKGPSEKIAISEKKQELENGMTKIALNESTRRTMMAIVSQVQREGNEAVNNFANSSVV